MSTEGFGLLVTQPFIDNFMQIIRFNMLIRNANACQPDMTDCYPHNLHYSTTLRDHIHGQKVILFTHNKKYDMLPSESGDELQLTKFHHSKPFILGNKNFKFY